MRTTVRFGCRELEVGGSFLTAELRESNDILKQPPALRKRLNEEGYLLIRGLHRHDDVLAVRQEILEKLAARSKLDPGAPLLEGVVNPKLEEEGTISVRNKEDYRSLASFQKLYGVL